MSALQIPPTPTPAPSGAPRPTPPRAREDGRPDLRLVEPPARRSLAPTGPLQAWRRRVGVLLVVAAVVLLFMEAVSGPVAPSQQMVPATTATVVVEPGQTLWDVAEEHAPADVAPGTYVRELAELNGISNGAIDAWQVLRLPS